MPEHIVAWAILLIPLMYSPGPTNILVASTGATFGFRNATPLIVGINVGLALQILVIALGVNRFFESHPAILVIMHWLGVFYMFWLAYYFFRTKRASQVSNGQSQKLSRKSAFIEGVLIEILNPKVWISLVVTFSVFAEDVMTIENGSTLLGAVTIGLNIVNNLMWAILGAFLIRRLCSGSFLKYQNYVYGLMLGSVGLWMLAGAIK